MICYPTRSGGIGIAFFITQGRQGLYKWYISGIYCQLGDFYGCFLQWWVFPPKKTPQVLIIFSRKNPMEIVGETPPFLGNPHMLPHNHQG